MCSEAFLHFDKSYEVSRRTDSDDVAESQRSLFCKRHPAGSHHRPQKQFLPEKAILGILLGDKKEKDPIDEVYEAAVTFYYAFRAFAFLLKMLCDAFLSMQ